MCAMWACVSVLRTAEMKEKRRKKKSMKGKERTIRDEFFIVILVVLDTFTFATSAIHICLCSAYSLRIISSLVVTYETNCGVFVVVPSAWPLSSGVLVRLP